MKYTEKDSATDSSRNYIVGDLKNLPGGASLGEAEYRLIGTRGLLQGRRQITVKYSDKKL